MEIILNIHDRVYNDIKTYCEANNIILEEYVLQIIEEKHSINKYGDLNEMMATAVEQSTVEVKKRAKRTKKKKEDKEEEPSVQENEVFIKIEQDKNSEQKEETTVEEIKEETVVKPTVTRKKRTLKTL